MSEHETIERVVLSHSDLDGVGCAFLIARCMKVDTIKFVSNYNDLHGLIQELVKIPRPMEVWITDLAIHRKTAKLLLKSHHDINLVDHHQTSTYLTEMCPWAVVDTTKSATKKVYEVLSMNFHLQDYSSLVEVIDNYDTWGGEKNEPTEEATTLNALCNLLGPFLMLNRLHQKPHPKISDVEAKFIAASIYKDEQYIFHTSDPIKFETDKGKGMMVCAERCTSKLGNILLINNPDIEFIAIINYNLCTIGFRGKGNINVGSLAKAINSIGGGGHPKAAGCSLSDMMNYSPMQIIEVITEAVSKIKDAK